MKYIYLIISAFILSGCASTPKYTEDGTPRPQYKIGGGEVFMGEATKSGNFVVVEEKTKRIITTLKVKKGQSLSYIASETALTKEAKSFEEDMGIPYSEARFAAYLIPKN